MTEFVCEVCKTRYRLERAGTATPPQSPLGGVASTSPTVKDAFFGDSAKVVNADTDYSKLEQKLSAADSRMGIGSLKAGMRRVDVVGVITSISAPREVTTRTGETSRTAKAGLKDSTGTVDLTLWNEEIDKVKVGDRVAVKNGYVTTFRGELQLNLGRYGKLEV